MSLYVPNEGEMLLLDMMLKNATATGEYYLHLYNNSYDPVAATTRTSFTDAVFGGYTVATLTRGANWSSATLVSGSAETSYGGGTALAWTCTSSTDTIYGYWVEDSTTGKVLWAEKFGTARAMAENDVLNLTPKFSLSTATA
jgi:hypothetical protein